MSKLGIMDIVALAKAGYKASEVKELMQIEVPEQKTEEVPAGSENPQPATEEKPKEQKVQEPVPEQASTSTSVPSESVIDYKKKFEEAESKLQKLQEQNTRKNMQPEQIKDPLSGIDDFLKSIM